MPKGKKEIVGETETDKMREKEWEFKRKETGQGPNISWNSHETEI